MGATAFVGRCMFAFVFLASAVNKLQTLSDPIAGPAATLRRSLRALRLRALFASKIGFPLYLVLLFTDGQLLLLGTLTEWGRCCSWRTRRWAPRCSCCSPSSRRR